MTALRRQQLYFGLVFVVAAALAALFERGVLPTSFLGGSTGAQYALDLLCVVLCMGGTYAALRLMSFPTVRRSIQTDVAVAYPRWAGRRTLIIALCVWVEVFAYFATLQSSTAQYTLLISLAAAVFCIPTAREMGNVSQMEDNR